MFNLAPEFKILRRIREMSPFLTDYLVREYNLRRKSIDPLTDKPRADVVNPATGWVDSDLPRDEAATTEIVQNTVQFAIGDPYGRLVPDPKNRSKPLSFKDFATADKARRSATVSFAPQISVDADEADEIEDEPSGENLAGTAGRKRDNRPT